MQVPSPLVGCLAMAGAQWAKGTVQGRTARHLGTTSLVNLGLRRVGGFGEVVSLGSSR